ncbi:hypothetical protein KC878_01325 [Candidatus Saccharibacteria bacterium]|nr:hypothetical protein [Candidatus Saccharibacteria bacterium]MCB9821126.1 hypothetical protein [Candidatus Nomurabacteria bacterium]
MKHLNKKFISVGLLPVLLFQVLVVVFGFAPKLSAAPTRAQCSSTGGTWITLDGGQCSCPYGYNATETGCLTSSATDSELNDLAVYVCSEITNSGERNDCVNNILQNGPTESNISNYCSYYALVNGVYSDSRNTTCLEKFTAGVGETGNGSSGGGSSGGGSSGGGSSGGQIGSGGGTDTNNPEPTPTQSACAPDEFDVYGVCDNSNQDTFTCDGTAGDCLGGLPIMKTLSKGLDIMSVIVVPLMIILLIVAGIQYTVAREDPGKVQSAKNRIYNVVWALVAYVFLWAFLQWLIPGGVF